MDKSRLFNISYSAIWLCIFTFVAYQLATLWAVESISRLYLYFYLTIAGLSISFASIGMLLAIIRETDEPKFAFLADIAPYRILSQTKYIKWILVAVFAIMIFFSTAYVQVLPIPTPLAQAGLQISPNQNTYLTVVPPALFEDFSMLIISCILIFAISMVFKRVGINLYSNPLAFTAVAGLTSGIVSLGYGWFLPGFASSHLGTYGANYGLYLAAFIFMFTQLFIYQVTGIFMPIAHMLHNFSFTQSVFTITAISGFTLLADKNIRTEIVKEFQNVMSIFKTKEVLNYAETN